VNITYEDVWLTRADGLIPSSGCRLLASIRFSIDTQWSYEVLLIDRDRSEWRVWAAICETESACCNCLGLFLNHTSNWQVGCKKTGLLLAASGNDVDIHEAAAHLFSSILRLRARGSFMGVTTCGFFDILSEARMWDLAADVRKEQENVRSSATQIGETSPMVALARQLYLKPWPSGEDEHSWTAPCPRAPHERWHNITISTKTEHFSCANCGVFGDAEELSNFYEQTIKLNFAPLLTILEDQVGSIKKVKKIYVTVSWYYDLISPTLMLHKTEWQKIIQGAPFKKNGRGFTSEEGFCHDFWLFNHAWPGSLEVDYDDGGQGFVGLFEDAVIEAKS
jgi:hypothetical protein